MKNFAMIFRLGLLMLMTVVIGGIAWNESRQELVSVKVDIRDDQNPVEVLPELGRLGTVTQVQTIDEAKNQYKITYRTSRKNALLGWILGKKWVENAEFSEYAKFRDERE